MGRQSTERATVNANGKFEISADQYREYQNLLKKRDNALISLQTQMRLQNAEALKLAKAVSLGLHGDTKESVAIVADFAAARAVELANELLLAE